MDSARRGEFIDWRENALYVDRIDGKLAVPSDVIPKSLARELILMAIEGFDDALAGYTNHSMRLSEHTDSLFKKWEAATV